MATAIDDNYNNRSHFPACSAVRTGCRLTGDCSDHPSPVPDLDSFHPLPSFPGPPLPLPGPIPSSRSPHSGGSSRSDATWLSGSPRFGHTIPATATCHNFHAATLGAAIFSESRGLRRVPPGSGCGLTVASLWEVTPSRRSWGKVRTLEYCAGAISPPALGSSKAPQGRQGAPMPNPSRMTGIWERAEILEKGILKAEAGGSPRIVRAAQRTPVSKIKI